MDFRYKCLVKRFSWMAENWWALQAWFLLGNGGWGMGETVPDPHKELGWRGRVKF